MKSEVTVTSIKSLNPAADALTAGLVRNRPNVSYGAPPPVRTGVMLRALMTGSGGVPQVRGFCGRWAGWASCLASPRAPAAISTVTVRSCRRVETQQGLGHNSFPGTAGQGQVQERLCRAGRGACLHRFSGASTGRTRRRLVRLRPERAMWRPNWITAKYVSSQPARPTDHTLGVGDATFGEGVVATTHQGFEEASTRLVTRPCWRVRQTIWMFNGGAWNSSSADSSTDWRSVAWSRGRFVE